MARAGGARRRQRVDGGVPGAAARPLGNYAMLAEMYQEREDFPEVRRLLGSALQRDPRAAKTLCALGTLELRSGASALAVDYASRCLAGNPVFPDGWYLLGLAWEASGDRGRAAAAHQRQLKVVPGHELARERLRVPWTQDGR